LGKGRVNTNSLAPGELNFLHTLRISSGSVDFGTVPVSIEASVGNTLYINSDNPSKTAPSTAGIYLTGGLNGSALSYEPAPRVWKLEPAASSSGRTISLPPLSPSSRLTLLNSTAVQFSSVVEVGAGSVFEILSGATGSVSFSEGLILKGDARFVHSGPQSLTLNPKIIGPGSASMAFLGTGTHQFAGLTQEAGGSLALDFQAGTARFTNPTLLSGSVTSTGLIILDADLSIISVSVSSPILTLSGGLQTGANSLSLVSTQNQPTRVEILTPASISGSPIVFQGSFSVIGGGVLPLSLSNASTVSLQNITVPNSVRLLPGNTLTLAAGNVVFQDSLIVNGGSLNNLSGTTSTIATLRVQAGGVSSGNTPFSITKALLVEGGVLTETGFKFTGAKTELSSVLALHSLESISEDLSFGNSVTVSGTCSIISGSITLPSATVLSCSDLVTGPNTSVFLGTGARLSTIGSMNLTSAAITARADTRLEVGTALLLGPGMNSLQDTSILWKGSTHTVSASVPTEVKEFLWADADGATTIQGNISLRSALSLVSHRVTISSDATLGLFSSLDVSPGMLSYSPTSVLHLKGVNRVSSSSTDPISLPSVWVTGSAFDIPQDTNINGSLAHDSGTITLSSGTRVNVAGAVVSSSGSFLVRSGSTFRTSGSTSFSNELLQLDSNSVFEVENVLFLNPVTLEAKQATLKMSTSGELKSGRSLLFNQLHVFGAGSKTKLDITQPLQIQSLIRIDAETELDFQDSQFILGVEDGRSAMDVNGVTRGVVLGSLTVIGQGADWTGSGRIHRLHLVLESVDDSIQFAGTDARLGESIVLESGSLNVGTAVLHFEPANHFEVFTSILDQKYSGSIVAQSPTGINPENVSVSLTVSGQVSGFPSLDPFLSLGPLFDLNIAASDALNSPAIFGLTSTLPIELRGSLFIDSNTFLSAPGVLSTGTDVTHQIRGRMGPGTFQGAGQILGNGTGVTSSLTFSGTSYQLTNLLAASSIIHTSGNLLIDGNVALTATDEI
jgi:hypothetical protein